MMLFQRISSAPSIYKWSMINPFRPKWSTLWTTSLRWFLLFPGHNEVQGSSAASRKREKQNGCSSLGVLAGWKRRFCDVQGSCGERHRKRSILSVLWRHRVLEIGRVEAGDVERGRGAKVSSRAPVWIRPLRNALRLWESALVGIFVSERLMVWSMSAVYRTLLFPSVRIGELWLTLVLSVNVVLRSGWESGCCLWDTGFSDVSPVLDMW